MESAKGMALNYCLNNSASSSSAFGPFSITIFFSRTKEKATAPISLRPSSTYSSRSMTGLSLFSVVRFLFVRGFSFDSSGYLD